METVNLDDEIWKRLIIDGIVFDYYISNCGRVYSMYWKSIVRGFYTKRNYKRVNIIFPKGSKIKARKFQVHRLVAYLFVPGYSPELTVNHKNGIHWDNHYTNLEWVTFEENNNLAIKDGLHPVGEEHPNAEYSTREIIKVCEYMQQGLTNQEILNITGISIHVIRDIKRRRAWTHISDNYVWSSDTNRNYTKYKEKVMKYFDEGLKTKDIMRKLNIPYSNMTIRNLISRLRLKYNKILRSTTIPLGVGPSGSEMEISQ